MPRVKDADWARDPEGSYERSSRASRDSTPARAASRSRRSSSSPYDRRPRPRRPRAGRPYRRRPSPPRRPRTIGARRPRPGPPAPRRPGGPTGAWSGATGQRLPRDLVAEGVHLLLFPLPAPPGRERGQHRLEGRVLVELQRLRKAFEVLALDGLPELRVHAGALAVGRGGLLRLRPVGLVLEGVRGEVDATSGLDGGVQRRPVDLGAAHVELGEGGQEGVRFRTALAQRTDQTCLRGRVGDGVVRHRREHGIGAQLKQRRHALGGESGQAVVEAHGLPDVADPVVGVLQLVGGGKLPGQVRDDRQLRFLVRQAPRHLAEVVENRVHQRRVERVRHLQPPHLATLARSVPSGPPEPPASPESTTCAGPFTAATPARSSRPSSNGSTSASAACTASIAPPSGSDCINCRAPPPVGPHPPTTTPQPHTQPSTHRSNDHRQSPAAPQRLSQANKATSTANSAGCA